nr:isoeugenol synthase 1 [Schisandra chinensis]
MGNCRSTRIKIESPSRREPKSDSMDAKNKILIFGATGYLGKYMVKASVFMGYPTSIYVRPPSLTPDSEKLALHQEFESMGVHIFQGDLDDHDKLVAVIKQVDIVISTLAVPQHLDQVKIIQALKEAGNIKRFVPSEFGNEVDRVQGIPAVQTMFDSKKKIRRAIEAAKIPFTFVTANCFGAYFVDFLLHPKENREEVVIYGTGEAKAVFNFEEDVAAYTIKAANDPVACNRVIIFRPPGNIVSQIDLISMWEKKTGKILKKNYVPEDEVIRLSETLPFPQNLPMGVLHNIFVKGDQTSFAIREDDLEASRLYPDYKYTSVDRLLDLFLVAPPKVKLATFA